MSSEVINSTMRQFPVTMEVVERSGQADAGRELFASRPPSPSLAAIVSSLQEQERECAPPEMLVARRRGRLVGGVWFQPLPASLARIWPAALVPEESGATARLLQTAADARLAGQGTQLAQALLADRVAGRCDESDLLLDCGYRHAADLAFLVSFPAEAPEEPPAVPFTLRPYDPSSDRPRLLEVLHRSYEGSRDLPTLLGSRSAETVLAGYEQSAPPDSRRWFLVHHAGEDAGCLLLTDQPRQGQWELLYVGLAPSIRGRGWGLELVRQAQWQAAESGRKRLVLAVDAANDPATRIYASAGFRTWDRRRMFAKVFSSSTGSAGGSATTASLF